MSEDPPGVYLPTSDPNIYESTPLANAGWYDEGQHGGSLAALIAGHVERTPSLVPMEIARITVELFRVVRLVPLTLQTRVEREGKKIQVLSCSVLDPAGEVAAAAVIHRLRTSSLPAPAQTQTELVLAGPDSGSAPTSHQWGIGRKGTTMFHRDVTEMREVYGGFAQSGPGAIWLRVTKPIIAGKDITPVQRAVAVADFPNGVSSELDESWVFMNSDLTVHIGRYPEGQWVGLEAISAYSDVGRGVATGTLWDESGWVGRTTQTLFLDRPRR